MWFDFATSIINKYSTILKRLRNEKDHHAFHYIIYDN